MKWKVEIRRHFNTFVEVEAKTYRDAHNLASVLYEEEAGTDGLEAERQERLSKLEWTPLEAEIFIEDITEICEHCGDKLKRYDDGCCPAIGLEVRRERKARLLKQAEELTQEADGINV